VGHIFHGWAQELWDLLDADRVELVIAVLVESALKIIGYSRRHIFLGCEKMLTIVVGVAILKTDTSVVDTGLGEPVDSRLRELLWYLLVEMRLVRLTVQDLCWSYRAQHLRV
jgi:hypothetical protein